MDVIDRNILNIIQKQGRISNKKLSDEIGLNPSSTLERVKKLEESGIIDGYSARLNYENLDYQTLVLVNVSLKAHNKENIDIFIEKVSKIAQVTEYYHIAGKYDFMLKVYTKNNKELQSFIIENITSISCVDKTETMLVFDEKKLWLDLS